MTAEELIKELQKVPKDSRIFMGYDGNIVVTEAWSVITPSKEEIGGCWWHVKSGDTVILGSD